MILENLTARSNTVSFVICEIGLQPKMIPGGSVLHYDENFPDFGNIV